MYPTISIFGLEFGSSNFFMILGIFSMIVVNVLRAKQFGVSKIKAVLISITNNVGAFAGAKVLFLLENINTLANGISFGGFSFYGTVFMLPVFMLITYNLYGMEKDKFFDYSTPSVLIELAFYRTGCLLAGCCCGIEAGWGIAMAHSPEVLRVPVQLIEIILDVGIFALLVAYQQKGRHKGLLYPIFMIAYGAIRFVLEFLRVRQVWIWSMSEAHFLSILAIAIGIIWIYFKTKKQKQQG